MQRLNAATVGELWRRRGCFVWRGVEGGAFKGFLFFPISGCDVDFL
jgi:hypothetical protein